MTGLDTGWPFPSNFHTQSSFPFYLCRDQSSGWILQWSPGIFSLPLTYMTPNSFIAWQAASSWSLVWPSIISLFLTLWSYLTIHREPQEQWVQTVVWPVDCLSSPHHDESMDKQMMMSQSKWSVSEKLKLTIFSLLGCAQDLGLLLMMTSRCWGEMMLLRSCISLAKSMSQGMSGRRVSNSWSSLFLSFFSLISFFFSPLLCVPVLAALAGSPHSGLLHLLFGFGLVPSAISFLYKPRLLISSFVNFTISPL